MSSFPTELLLRYQPYEALLIQFNETHGTGLDPRYVELESVSGGPGATIQVTLVASDIPPNKDTRSFIGRCTITVQRLDIASIFHDGVHIPHQGNIVSSDVSRILTEQTGVVFDDTDFITEILTPQDSILRTHPDSLRWYGQLTVTRT